MHAALCILAEYGALTPALQRECERHLPSPDSVEPPEAADMYRFLKSCLTQTCSEAKNTSLIQGLYLSGCLLMIASNSCT